MAGSDSKNPNGSTGPTSPEGKATSSQNSLKHGLCSQKLILPNENAAEFEEIKEKWLDDSVFDEPQLFTLAEQAAVAEWFHRRALREYNEVRQHLYELQPDFIFWTHDEVKLLERFQRYLTTRERAFNRAAANYQSYYNECRRAHDRGNKLREETYKLLKADPELNIKRIEALSHLVQLPRRYLSQLVLNHPLRPDSDFDPSESPPAIS